MASGLPSSAPAQAPSAVSVSADDDSLGERLRELLNRAGYDLIQALDDGADVRVDAHARADGAVCATLREAARRRPDAVQILVLERAPNGDVRRALQAGAHAVVIHESVEDALVPSIRAAQAGQVVIPAQARRAGEQRVLTTREKQILGLVVMGMSNAQIASKLFLAESTVKSHLSSAFAKLDVSSRNEAVRLILDPERGAGLGILSIPAEPLPSAARGRLTRPRP
jgi:DNA-binding NarL/FixJ family response regulator